MPSNYKVLHIKTCIRSVTTAGTREKFQLTDESFQKVKAITIRANATNVGNLYLGDSNRVSSADYHYILAPGETVSLSVMESDKFKDLYLEPFQWWIDADTDGNGLTFIALVDSEPW